MAARLREKYSKEVSPSLQKEFGYSNPMSIPRLEKIVLNVGLGEAIQNAKAIDAAVNDLVLVAGQKPVVTKAKKSIALATQVDRNSAYMFELEAYNRMVPTADRLEGVRAFNEKRKPRFEGR